jgi:PhnB protein
VPEGYHTVTPYLAVEDAAQAIEFYTRRSGQGDVRMDAPGGKIGHAELEIGDSHIMVSDPFPQASTKPPKELGGTSFSVMMYVDDVDAAFKRAVDAGATVRMELDDMFWGDRFGTVTDPFGHVWGWPATSRTCRRRRWLSARRPRWRRWPRADPSAARCPRAAF